MGKREKKFNKWIIGAIIGGTIVGLGGLSMSPKGKSFWGRMHDKFKGFFGFIQGGVDEIKKIMK